MELSSSSAAASAAQFDDEARKVMAMPAYAKNLAKTMSEAASSLQSSLPEVTSGTDASAGPKYGKDSSDSDASRSHSDKVSAKPTKLAKPSPAASAADSPAPASVHLDIAESGDSDATVRMDDQAAVEQQLGSQAVGDKKDDKIRTPTATTGQGTTTRTTTSSDALGNLGARLPVEGPEVPSPANVRAPRRSSSTSSGTSTVQLPIMHHDHVHVASAPPIKRGFSEAPAATAARRRTTPSPARPPDGHATVQDNMYKQVLDRLAATEARFADMQRQLDAQTAVVQQRDSQLNQAERVTHLLRQEAEVANSTAKTETAKFEAAKVECHRTRHELTARLQAAERAKQEATRQALQEAEAEAERRHTAAMENVESNAQKVYDRDVANLKFELGQALAQSSGDHSHAASAAPCPQCPVKQARITALEAELAATAMNFNSANNKLVDLEAKHEHDKNNLQKQISELTLDLGKARDLANDLQVQKDAEIRQGHIRLREAQERHAARESELTGHAESLSTELERVKSHAAALHASADSGNQVALRKIEDEL